MEQEPPQDEQPPVRITDRRGQNAGGAAPQTEPVQELDADTRAALEEALAEQGRAAEAPQPISVSAFMVVTIDSLGRMRMHHSLSEVAQLMQLGINAEREATPADISNMVNQLHMTLLGNEVAGHVMQALHAQAQQQILARMPDRGGLSVPRR